MIGPELFLSGPSAVDEALCASDRSAEGLIPIASNAVDILLCYLQSKAQPSPVAACTVNTALAVYADALPQEGALHDALGTLRQKVLSVPVAQRRKGEKRHRPETAAHLLRAIASGVPSVRPDEDIAKLQRDLCLQLHLCNFLQCVRALSLLNHHARRDDSPVTDSSRLFLGQVTEYLRHIVHNTDAADLSWEYKLHLFALNRT